MIRLRASAVLAVYDGYSCQAISASMVQCFLDGQRILPQYRQGGYLVFINLEPGIHELLLRGAYYQEERLRLQIDPAQPVQYTVALKPAANYPFRRAVTQLSALLEGGAAAAGQQLWVALKTPAQELRLAQEEAAAGSESLKLYFRGRPEGRFPGQYLFTDRGGSEVVLLDAPEEGQARLGAALAFQHKRGATLFPAHPYRADAQGRVQIFLREPMPVYLFCPEKKRLYLVPVTQGYNEAALTPALQEKE